MRQVFFTIKNKSQQNQFQRQLMKSSNTALLKERKGYNKNEFVSHKQKKTCVSSRKKS